MVKKYKEQKMIHTIEIYFLLFMSYAFLGWCMEVICKLIQTRKFINRGFLIGPYCPIYGWGAIAITVLLKRYTYDILVLFVMSMIVCSIIEYFTSYFMEKKYHARWWDYSNKKFNINGRICLETLIPFGILGVIIMYVTNPLLLHFFETIPQIILHIITATLFIVFIVDNAISSNVIASINVEGSKLIKDNTEEITERVKDVLRKKSWLHRRLVNAYPNLKDIKVKIKKIKEKVENKID
ncbi:MAG: putative ABC transporter permease [Clostridia bacterium]